MEPHGSQVLVPIFNRISNCWMPMKENSICSHGPTPQLNSSTDEAMDGNLEMVENKWR